MTRSEVQPICRYWQAERQSVPRRAEQVPSVVCLDGASQGGRGTAGEWKRDRRNVEQGPACGMRPWSRSRRVASNADPCASPGVRSQRVPLPPLDAPRSFFRGSDLEGGRGRRAIPLRLISGRIPNLKLGPLLHLDSRPSGDAPRARTFAEWCRKGRARLRPRFLNGALVRLLPQTSLRRTGRSRTPETRIGPDTPLPSAISAHRLRRLCRRLPVRRAAWRSVWCAGRVRPCATLLR